MHGRILVVEDEEVLRKNLHEYLEKAGYSVESARDGRAALDMALEDDYALVVTDIRMPRMDGIELLKNIVSKRPETPVLIITAYASVDTAIEALRFGAFDYMLKPVIFEDLLQKVRNLVSYGALKKEVLRLRRDIHKRLGFEGIVGESPGVKRVFDLIDKVAPSRSTVLITGESGTGKELVARAIHARSQMADKEFLAVNAAAIPSEVLESQLFGHEKGAFTGATQRKEGVFRSVAGGTVLLDEVGELPLSAQVKLLRAVESKEILPVGGERPVLADFRLIAATNRRLEESIADGKFREDLFFRLSVFRIETPPLRDRREDIPALVQHFIKQHGSSFGKLPEGVSNEAMRALLEYDWPGNVRELSNIIERAVILAAGSQIRLEHLPSDLCERNSQPLSLRKNSEAAERRHIEWVLRLAEGKREKAAAILEVDRATLYRKLEKYGLK